MKLTGKVLSGVKLSIYLYNKEVLVAWLVDDNLLLRDFGCYGVIFMNVCVVNHCHGNTVQRFWALLDNIYMTMCVYYFRFFHYS
jgi:hypothetical protein